MFDLLTVLYLGICFESSLARSLKRVALIRLRYCGIVIRSSLYLRFIIISNSAVVSSDRHFKHRIAQGYTSNNPISDWKDTGGKYQAGNQIPGFRYKPVTRFDIRLDMLYKKNAKYPVRPQINQSLLTTQGKYLWGFIYGAIARIK